MTTKLGAAILIAMRDQGWTLVGAADVWLCVSSQNPVALGAPVDLFNDTENEDILRDFLLVAIIQGGLQWPWPPDHLAGFHGEVPRED